jgi:hypothetical protein
VVLACTESVLLLGVPLENTRKKSYIYTCTFARINQESCHKYAGNPAWIPMHVSNSVRMFQLQFLFSYMVPTSFNGLTDSEIEKCLY